MRFIHHEYAETTRQLAVRPDQVIEPPHRRERVIVPVPNISRPVVQAVNFGRSIADDVRAVHVTDDAEAASRAMRRPGSARSLACRWSSSSRRIAPWCRPSWPTSTWSHRQTDEVMTIVIVPEYVASHWWERVLYNQLSNRIRRAIIGRPHTVVTSLPYRRERRT